MSKRIFYPNKTGISVLIPANCGLTIEQIAKKDVPNGTPYLIVDTTEIPSDRADRDLWTADFTNPTGYGGQV